MDLLTIKTYGKINLSLDVTGKREDGYHFVRMIMHAVELYDEIKIRLFPSEIPEIQLKTDKYYIPVDERNTAYQAAMLMREHFNPNSSEIIRIDIKKNIPVAAGLAGGSSNAAGVIIALDKLWNLGISRDELCKIGLKIGADVPFSIMSIYGREHPSIRFKAKSLEGVSRYDREGGDNLVRYKVTKKPYCVSALAENIGEKLTEIVPVSAWVLMVKPNVNVSTAEIYKELDNIGNFSHPNIDKVIEKIKSNNMEELKEYAGNVLENVTLAKYPYVLDIKNIMMGQGAYITLMSGSGPTLFSLFTEKKKARAAYDSMKKVLDRKDEIFLVKTLL